MSSSHVLRMAAWGQYLHWAHLQFERFVELPDETEMATKIAAVSHWLAAEYVVLEGWRELGVKGGPVSTLLNLYPEHQETLRRCRNAVYHYQNQLLDPRIVKCIQNEDEELTWAAALHEEFQRFLAAYPYLHPGSFSEQSELAEEIAACIGWSPEATLTASQYRIFRKVLKLHELTQDDLSPSGDEAREMIARTSEKAVALRFDNHLKSLTRWPADAFIECGLTFHYSGLTAAATEVRR